MRNLGEVKILVRSSNSYVLKELEVHRNSRRGIREEVVLKFLQESPGKKYQYLVEDVSPRQAIYLKRPCWPRQGFDFEIWVRNWSKGIDKRPSHKVILSDLKRKKRDYPETYKRLRKSIIQVYNCEEPTNNLGRSSRIHFSTGLRTALITKVLKWMFIEQDINYWNYTGRDMLRQAIDRI